MIRKGASFGRLKTHSSNITIIAGDVVASPRSFSLSFSLPGTLKTRRLYLSYSPTLCVLQFSFFPRRGFPFCTVVVSRQRDFYLPIFSGKCRQRESLRSINTLRSFFTVVVSTCMHSHFSHIFYIPLCRKL